MTPVVPVKFRPGRAPFDPTRTYLELGPRLANLTPKPSYSWADRAPADGWGMLGNDEWGDCGEAGFCHAIDLWTENELATADALALYTSVTGFDPNAGPPGSNPTDNGTNLADLLGYVHEHGFRGHTLAAFAHLDPSNTDGIKIATEVFGGTYLGITFPQSAEDQFNAGQPWTVVPDSPIMGGHCVLAIGYDADYLYVVSWGAVIPMAWSFWQAYGEEAWALATEQWLTSGTTPEGLDVAGLNADFEALFGQPGPFTTPAPSPTPAPTPGPAPAPVHPLLTRVRAILADLEREVESWLSGHDSP